MILSQILRGLADATAHAAAGGALAAIDAETLAAALWRGVELVVTSMGGDEVPGTIVSVLRAAAGAATQRAADGESLGRTVVAACDAAVVALEKTTEQLDVLADAGVVDAGGGACWSCWIRCVRRSPAQRPPGRSTSRHRDRRPSVGRSAAGRRSSR